MQFLDFSPPTIPTLDQQRDALQKGLGRSLQWAAAGTLSTELLLGASLHDLRYDKQCEENRGSWLWDLMTAVGATQQLRDPILASLIRVTDGWNADQLCELAVHFAENGDEESRTQLYEFIGQRRISDSPETGQRQLLRLDGERAFLFLVGLHGQQLATRDWNWGWDDAFFIDLLTEYFEEPRVRELLNASLEPEVRRFARAWVDNANWSKNSRSQRDAHVKKMRAIPVNEVLHAIKTEHEANWLRGWGKYADEQDLETILSQLWEDQDPSRIVKYLKIFSNRPLPYVNARLIGLCSHTNGDVRRRALSVMEKNSHPLIRSFALNELIERNLEQPVAGLFIKNFESGDEQRLLDQVELPEDPCQRHWLLRDVIKMLEVNESANSRQLAQIAYFHTPCQNCRSNAARLLFEQGHMPNWMREECRSDAEIQSRTLVESPGEHDKQTHEGQVP